jgi:hypothetical protein
MKGQGRLLLLTLVACLLVGCRSAARHKEPGRAYDAKNKFSIIPPEGWTEGSGLMGCFMVFTGPMEEGFTVNFNVNVQPETRPSREGMPETKRALARVLNGYVLMDEGFVTIDGREASFLSSAFDMPAGKVQNLQYFITTGKKVYVVTFTASQAVFEKYRPIFEKSGLSARMDE